MRSVVIAAVVGSSALAAPQQSPPPAQTRDVDKLPLPAVPTRGLCMIERTLTAQGEARMQLVYTNDGKLLRREWWNLDGATPAQEGWVAYSWANGRVTQAADQNDLVTSYRFDQRGLPTHIESPNRTQDLAWKLTPLAKPQRIVQPRATLDAAPVPLALAFEGSLEITTTEGAQKSSATYRYEPHGNLIVSGCDVDARGRPTTCTGRAVTIANRWQGDQLIETKTHQGNAWTRETYTYDGSGRITAIARAASSDDGKTYVVDERTRYEYRCPGNFVDEPLWTAK